MKTLGEVLTLSAQFLKDKNCVRFRRSAEELIGYALKLKRLDLYLQFDRPVLETELESIRQGLKRIVKGEPVEYIIGEVEFYHCVIEVNSNVLIPRPETELLVDQVCKMNLNGVVWDLCTGSGYIGIAIKKACPNLHVSLSDISIGALTIARKNVERNNVEVECFQGDLLEPFKGRKADVVVCNPPYVSLQDYLELDGSVKDFEPRLALVGGEDGLEFYRRLKEELPDYLNTGAKIFFEIGANQGPAVLALFSTSCWKKTRIEKDWAGHDRFFFLEFD